MPMRIDRYYRYADAMPRHLERLADACGYPQSDALEQIATLAANLPDVATEVAAQLRAESIAHPVLDALIDGIAWRCAKIRQAWGLKVL